MFEAADEIDMLRENGQRLLAVADSAVQHQHDMIEAACAPLLESMASERHRAFLLAERVRVLEGALEGALKWGAALSPDEHAKCRAALKRED
jgi:hypothetical protein